MRLRASKTSSLRTSAAVITVTMALCEKCRSEGQNEKGFLTAAPDQGSVDELRITSKL